MAFPYLAAFTAGFSLIFFSASGYCEDGVYAPSETAYYSDSVQTKSVAEPYFKAYLERDWGAVEALVTDDVTWFDPTAEKLFDGRLRSGKTNALAFFRKAYAPITAMTFKPTRTMFASNIAIYEGSLSWATKISKGRLVETKDMPFVVILKIVGGKVQEHRDYADYGPFIQEFRKVRSVD